MSGLTDSLKIIERQVVHGVPIEIFTSPDGSFLYLFVNGANKLEKKLSTPWSIPDTKIVVQATEQATGEKIVIEIDGEMVFQVDVATVKQSNIEAEEVTEALLQYVKDNKLQYIKPTKISN